MTEIKKTDTKIHLSKANKLRVLQNYKIQSVSGAERRIRTTGSCRRPEMTLTGHTVPAGLSWATVQFPTYKACLSFVSEWTRYLLPLNFHSLTSGQDNKTFCLIVYWDGWECGQGDDELLASLYRTDKSPDNIPSLLQEEALFVSLPFCWCFYWTVTETPQTSFSTWWHAGVITPCSHAAWNRESSAISRIINMHQPLTIMRIIGF